MSKIDIFSWIVLLVMIASVVVVFVVLGKLPGQVAQDRQHPQAEAINVASWLALIFGFAGWPFVLVWAYLRPIDLDLKPEETGLEAENGQPAIEGRDYVIAVPPPIPVGVPLLSVLQMQGRTDAARLSIINIRSQRLINRVNLHQSLGGSFDNIDPDLPRPQG